MEIDSHKLSQTDQHLHLQSTAIDSDNDDDCAQSRLVLDNTQARDSDHNLIGCALAQLAKFDSRQMTFHSAPKLHQQQSTRIIWPARNLQQPDQAREASQIGRKNMVTRASSKKPLKQMRLQFKDAKLGMPSNSVTGSLSDCGRDQLQTVANKGDWSIKGHGLNARCQGGPDICSPIKTMPRNTDLWKDASLPGRQNGRPRQDTPAKHAICIASKLSHPGGRPGPPSLYMAPFYSFIPSYCLYPAIHLKLAVRQ